MRLSASSLADLIGKPFRDGGRGPDGYDCWGLVIEVMRRCGQELPDYKIGALEFAKIGAEIEQQRPMWRRLVKLSPPCLLLIRLNVAFFCNHIGVYIGEELFIHAREKTGVCLDRVTSPAWAKRIEGFYVRD